jgi:hypothetical protein
MWFFRSADFWDKVENQRKLFENYARDNEFNPLIPDNWYSQPKEKILNYKV